MHLNDTTFTQLVWQQFWQCSLLVLAVFLICKLIRFRRAHLTFLLWLLVLLKFMTPPLWSSSSGLFCWVQESLTASAEENPSQPEQRSLTLTESIRLLIGDDMRQLPDFEPNASRMKITVHDGTAFEKQNQIFDTAAVLPESVVNESERPAFKWTFIGVALIAWVFVAALITGVMGVRYGRCWIMLRRAGEQHRPELNQLIARLCAELRLKRRVRLIITNSRLGPAVIGLFRPTIILPAAITDARSLQELEPILAHELIHIRRGDLWIGLFQLLASVVWWFHPLVWFTGRRLKLEIEQCCDEEVLAGLNCDPRIYARCLLEVLELKQTLNTVPVVPGVRPVEITSKRLERIMKLGQGCQKRTPWWYWLVFIMLAAIVLPGAAFVVTAADPEVETSLHQSEQTRSAIQQTSAKQAVDSGQQAADSVPFYDELEMLKSNKVFRQFYSSDIPYFSSEIDIQDWISRTARIRVYPIKELLEKARNTVGPIQAEQFLEKKINTRTRELGGLAEVNGTPKLRGSTPIYFGESQIPLKDERTLYRVRRIGGSHIRNEQLFVWGQDPAYHAQVEQVLAELATEEITPLELKMKFIEVPRSLLDQISSQRKNVKVFQVKQIRGVTEGEKSGELVSIGAETISRPSLICEVLDEKRFKEVQHLIAIMAYTETLSAPCVRFMDGQSVQFETKQRSEFKMKFKGSGQQFSVVNADVGLAMNVTYSERKGINQRGMLEYQIAYSEVDGLKKQKVLDAKTGQEQEVEVPLIRESHFKDVSLMKPGQVLLVGGLDLHQETEVPKVLLVMFQLEKVKPVESGQVLHGIGVDSDAGVTGSIQLDESNFKNQEPLLVQIYPVADLVVPVPRKLVGAVDQQGPVEEPAQQPRFEPLIELIKQNVTPDAWDDEKQAGSTIMPYPKMLALVVRQTREGHEKLAELIQKLRTVQDVMLQLDMQVITTDDMQAWLKEWDLSQSYEDRNLLQQLQAQNLNHGIVLNSKQVVSMKQMLEQGKRVNRVHHPKLTLFNGQSAELSLSGEHPPHEKQPYRIQVRPELLKDQNVRLSFAINAKDALDALSQINTAIIPTEKSILIDLTDQITDKESAFLFQQWVRQTQLSYPKKNKRCFLLVTPTVLKVSETAERRATPPRPLR